MWSGGNGWEHRLAEFERVADTHRDKLIELYGDERGSRVKWAEGFEGSEYGGSLTKQNIPTLFPFL
jgi:hypothetical protein